MAALNSLPCGNALLGNSGLDPCSIKMKFPQYILRHPVGTSLTAADLANLGVGASNANIKAKLQAEDPFARWQIWGPWVGVESNDAEAQNFDYPDGSSETVRDEVYKLRFQHRNNHCYHKQLIRQNNQEGNFLNILIDTDGVFWGTTDNSGNFIGVADSRFYTGPFQIATTTTPSQFFTNIDIADSSQLNIGSAVVVAGKGIGTILTRFAVQDVTLQLGGTPTGGAYPILALVGCAGKALASYDTAAALATPSAWVVTNQLGGAITITSVVKNGSNYVFTLDTTDADYTAATTINFKLSTIATVSGLFKALVSQDVAGNPLFNTPKV